MWSNCKITMKKLLFSLLLLSGATGSLSGQNAATDATSGASTPTEATTAHYRLFPANRAKGVAPDTHLTLTFNAPVTVNDKGMIRIYEAGSGQLVDSLDLSIPAGPTQPDTIRKQKATYTAVPPVRISSPSSDTSPTVSISTPP